MAPATMTESLQHWREQALSSVMKGFFALGLMLAVPSVWYSWVTDRHAIIVADAVAIAWLALTALWPGISYRLRAASFLLLCYGFSVWFMTEVLLVGLAYQLSLAPLAGLLLGLVPALIALLLMLLTDQTMPGLSGEALVIEVHALRPELPVILVSGWHGEADQGASTADRNVHYLAKPFGQRALARLVGDVLARVD